MASLAATRYGKDNIRVYKVHKGPTAHSVTEMTVCVLLEGDIDTSYTQADNSVVVPTDTMKQTTYIVAKQHPVNPPELFGAILAQHFVDQYAHIHTASVSVVQHRWTRMHLAGEKAPHPHSFYRDGEEKRRVRARALRGRGIELHSGISGLLVLKSTGSAFHGFDTRDPYTILRPTDDRILSTDVDAGWDWKTFASVKEVEEASRLTKEGGEGEGTSRFDAAWRTARDITMKTFATDDSASVQNTMYKMCRQILDAEEGVRAVDYTLPNKHYFEIDLSWHKGLKNLGSDAEVYAPQSDPNGLIHCAVSR